MTDIQELRPQNEVERAKSEKDGLDVLADILRYAKTGFDSIDPDDMMRFRWYGIYQQRPNEGHFMMRIKVPGGQLTGPQLKAVGGIARDYARGFTDITTRQNFQFHWLTIEDFPDIFRRLYEVGITTSGACGDIMRNITGCPVSGLNPDEAFDAQPYINQVHDYFLGNKEFSNLPRKYKASIEACPLFCAQPEINDIGATAAVNGNEPGFHIRVGGGLSSRPHLAKKMNMWVPGEKLIDVFRAITEIFRDHGERHNRKRARLKFLVEDWGIEKFEEEVRARLKWSPDPALDIQDPAKNFRDHLGIHAQKQEGLHWIGVNVLSGRLTADQLLEAGRISQQYGTGAIRTTNQQNFLVPNVPTKHVDAVAGELSAIGLRHTASPIRRAAVACTGNEFCNLALTETKKLIFEVVEHLEQTVALDELIRISLNGCPNSCGQHHIGDIGLQGCVVKQGAEKVEGYDIYLGGRLGRDAKFVRPIQRKVPATKVKYAIEHLLNGYMETKDEDENFSDFVDRTSDEQLGSLMRYAFVGEEVA